MCFDEVAKKIVRDSINTAICIDDEFVEPYSSIDNSLDPNFEMVKDLYTSFKKNKCLLDIYKYDGFEDWQSKKDIILKNKDLLILDWELPKYEDALKILREGIQKYNLPFVLIYTQLPIGDIESKIVFNLYSYFGKNYTNEQKGNYDIFCENLEEEIHIDINKFFKKISPECKSYILAVQKKKKDEHKRIMEKVKSLLKDEDEDVKNFKPILLKYAGQILKLDEEDLWEFIGFHFENAEVNPNGNFFKFSRIDLEGHSFIINNSIITIFSKQHGSGIANDLKISPDNVYNSFSKMIYRRPQNFISLLALEMKNLYQQHSNVIGRELFYIDENAFFYHQKNLNDEDYFYDFLRNCWKNQISSFNLIQNPKLFSVLEEYKNINQIDKNIENYKKEKLEHLQKELVKLNYYYSFMNINRKEKDKIRFGDLFIQSKDQNGKDIQCFILCITPHCDCLHPAENIKHKFHFVIGSKVTIEEGLFSAEQGFYSFIIYKDEPLCIKWNRKPFTLYINKDENNISLPIKISYNKSKYYLLYIENQKENYTQRIANEAFSFASRVGIELASLRLKSGYLFSLNLTDKQYLINSKNDKINEELIKIFKDNDINLTDDSVISKIDQKIWIICQKTILESYIIKETQNELEIFEIISKK